MATPACEEGTERSASVSCSRLQPRYPMDSYVIGAVLCFVLGGTLILIGLLRLAWFFTTTRHPKRYDRTTKKSSGRDRTPYYLDFWNSMPTGNTTYQDTPALWY